MTSNSRTAERPLPAFFRTMDRFKPIYDWAHRVVLNICKVLLIADILITSYAVLGRYVPFIKDPSWSEEVVLSLMVYMAVLSAALALRKGTHIRMSAFDHYLPRKLRLASDLLADACVLIFGVIMLVVGLRVCWYMRLGSYSSMPWLSRFWMYFPIPLAGIVMLIFELERVYQHVRAFFVPEDVEQVPTPATEEVNK